MFTGFDFNVIARSLPYLFRDGMVFTVTLTALAMTGGVFLGTLLAMMRLSSYTVLNIPAGAYVNLIRSIPLVLVIFWFYFLVPFIGGYIFHKLYQLNPDGIGRLLVDAFGNVVKDGQPIAVGAVWSSVITFTMFEAAYYCEIMRAGIQSVSRGQVSAAYALGLNYWQTMGHVVLPQAFRNMIPVLLTQTVILFQDTSLVYVISLTDFLGAAVTIANRDGRLVEMYLFAALIYFVVSFSVSQAVRQLQTKLAVLR
jgi:glutamate/aspartate transport system permease protein